MGVGKDSREAARALESSMVRVLEKGRGLALRLSELAAAGEISWPLNGVTIRGSSEHWASEFSPTGTALFNSELSRRFL